MKAPNAATRRRMIEDFEAAGATGPHKTIFYRPERAIEHRQFDRLRKAGVIVEGEGGRFYLDPEALDAFHRRTRGRVAVAIGVAVAGALWAIAS